MSGLRGLIQRYHNILSLSEYVVVNLQAGRRPIGSTVTRGTIPNEETYFRFSLNFVILLDYKNIIPLALDGPFGWVPISIISRIRNSNLGLCSFPFKCCVSQLSVDQMSRNLVNF